MRNGFDNLPNLQPNEEITVDFFKGTSSFKDDSVKIKNVRYYSAKDTDNEKDSLFGEIVNTTRKKTWFEFYFNEIKCISDSKGTILWENTQIK